MLPSDKAFIQLAYAGSTTEDEYGNHIVLIGVYQYGPAADWLTHERWHSKYVNAEEIEYKANEALAVNAYWKTRFGARVMINKTLAATSLDALAMTRVTLNVSDVPEVSGEMVMQIYPMDAGDFWLIYYVSRADWIDGPDSSTTYTVSFKYEVLRPE